MTITNFARSYCILYEKYLLIIQNCCPGCASQISSASAMLYEKQSYHLSKTNALNPLLSQVDALPNY